MPEQRITCEYALERLTEYLEAALGPDEHQSVEAHLTGCRTCRQTFEELRLTISLLSRLRQR